jgi:HlyD family secretion protein
MSRKFPARRLGPVAVLVVLPLLAISSLHYWPRSAGTIELPTVQVQTGDLLSAVTATGTVEAHRTVDIKYDTQSLVTDLNVQEGDRVSVNQSLATMDVRLLQPALAEARQTLQKDQAGLALAEASLHRAQALAAAQVLAQVDLETAEANYKSILHETEADRGAVALAEEQISRAHLLSPIRGVVIALYVHRGEMLGSATAVAGLGPNAAVSKPTNTLMTIAEEGSLEVDADVNAVDMGGVFTGQEAKFTLDASQGKVFSGSVKSIALQPTVLTGVTTYRVILSVPRSVQEFRIGMPSNIMLFRTITRNVVLVPPPSVFKEGSRAFLFTIEKDSARDRIHLRKMEVQVLGETPLAVAIRGQIGEGTRILATPDPQLADRFSLTANVKENEFQPNPDLSDLQFERKASSAIQALPAIPGPKPKNFLQRLLNP